MKYTALCLLVLLLPATAHANQHVNGYTRHDGTYVQGYDKSTSDNTVTNNYSYKGNQNPNTGKSGSDYYTHDTTSQYYQGSDSRGRNGHSSSSGSYGNPYGQ